MFDEFDQQNALLLKKLKKEKSLTYNEIKDLIGIDETAQELPHATVRSHSAIRLRPSIS